MSTIHENESSTASLLAQLAQPTRAYRRHVWLAVAGLVVFIILYLVLAGWFIDTAYRLTLGADQANFVGYLVGGCSLFLALLMLKPVLFVKHGLNERSVEITPDQQPRLFEFLYELADAAEAPRPHRVFVSPDVNAAVFYDISAMNLIFPSKKNLEIGLALVNTLTLGELRAVLAHEFGHFTQRSMAVMRWVYVTQQIAAHVVLRRDKLDELLVRLSHQDPRIAWLGWLLSIVVWSIRSLVDSAFGALIILQRALSREMEFQADLVAVALTGSDALVHALHRMQAADDSWERTLNLVGSQDQSERIPRDVFALHTHMMQRIGSILSDPEYGQVPPLPAENADKHRVFEAELAQPPKMWLTHPLNHEREANAKRHYVSAPIDDRSAWTLFDDADALRAQVSAAMFAAADKPTIPVEESLGTLNEQLGREYLDPRYRGVYLGRSVARSAERAGDLFSTVHPGWREQLDPLVLYPESLIGDVARLRTLEKEIGQLRALQSGALAPSEGVIRHRGRAIKRSELPQVIERVQREIVAVERRLATGDRMRRSVHFAAATELGNGWPAYLQGLLAALHYGDHTASNIRDLQGMLRHVVHMATVTRRVSSRGRKQVLAAANELHRALGEAHAQSGEVRLDSTLLQELGIPSWQEGLGKFELGAAVDENLGDWLNVVDGWVDQIAGPCAALRIAALEKLLVTEAAIANHIRLGTKPEPAPAPSRVPAKYVVLLEGQERERATTLNLWQRFQIADGAVPTVARVLAAATIVAAVLGFGGNVGIASVTVYNGLSTPVVVRVGVQEVTVAPYTSQTRDIDASIAYRVEARTRKGTVIEAFTPELAGSFAHFVYNVAGAAPLVEWTAVYGNVPPEPERYLGAPRWSRTSADVLFDDPPESISSSGGGARRTVLTGLGNAEPGRQLAMIEGEEDRLRLIESHVRWDATTSANIMGWFAGAQRALPSFPQILAERLAQSPNDVVLLRAEQDAASGAAADSVCARQTAMASQASDNADLQYVAARCITDDSTKAQAFRAGHARWPEHGWFAYAAGYDEWESGRTAEALATLETARHQLRPVSQYVTVDIARIRRLLDRDSSDVMKALSASSEELRALMDFEGNAKGTSVASRAYAALAVGELDKALRIAQRDSEVAAAVLRMAAASDGATAEMQERALALDPSLGMGTNTRWASIALAVRAGGDYSALVDSSGFSPQNLRRLNHFLALLRAGKDLTATEHALDGLPPFYRGQGYSMGVIVLGEKAPASWRLAAKRLLFASERPYFK